MTIHATFNPIGSTNPKDLIDNAQNLDYLILGPALLYPDRRGVSRLSWAGIEASFASAQAQREAEHDTDQARRESEFDADQTRRESEFDTAQGDRAVQFNTFMDASGYEPPIAYAAGILLDRTTKTVSYLGNEYRAKGSLIPFTTSNWATDEAKLKLIGDDSLRQDAANSTDPSKGAGMLGFGMAVPYAPNTLGSRVRNFTKAYYNPLDYGAVGDGSATDTSAVQNCISDMPDDSVLWLPGDRVFNISGGVTITQQNIQITGGGTLKNGPLILNKAALPAGEMNCDINHIKFVGSEYATNGIELITCRRVTITNCIFETVNAGVLRRGDAGQSVHNVAMVRITNNDFNTVNYGFKVQHNADALSWQYTSDCAFDNNTINIARICHIEMDGIDGTHITGNVMFMVGYTSGDAGLKGMKTNNIKIGQSDWIIISGNNLFEAGLESIVLDKSKHFSITNNHCAWPGQRQPSDAIRITGSSEPNGVISGNTLSRFTRHGVSIETNLGGATATNINVLGNTIEWLLNPPSYYGAVDLSSIPHHSIYQPDNSPTIALNTSNSVIGGLFPSIRARLAEGIRVGPRSAIAGTPPITKTVTAATAIAKMTSELTSLLSTSYAGLLQIEVRAYPGSTNSNMASYFLHVTKVPSQSGVVSVISAQGLTTGGSANHPSFTFTVVSDYLTATPVGSTSGTFMFTITAVGGIGVYS